MRSGVIRVLLLAATLACPTLLAAQTPEPAPPDSAPVRSAAGTDSAATPRAAATPGIPALPAALPTDSSPAFAPAPRGIRPVAVAKWATLLLSTAAAVYGYRENRLADSRYGDLDRICQADPTRCQARTSTGAYQDAQLEAQYQEVKQLDHRAAVGLVGAEVGIATTVALFLLDLRHAVRNPPNIPYNPPKLQVVPRRDGGVEIKARLGIGRRSH